jgi:hypothetical protein
MILPRRHRVFPLSAPRLATREAFQPEPAAPQRAVAFHRLQKICGTGRLKPATGARPAQDREDRRERPLVGADEETNEQNHGRRRIGVRPARRKFPAPPILPLVLLPVLVLVIENGMERPRLRARAGVKGKSRHVFPTATTPPQARLSPPAPPPVASPTPATPPSAPRVGAAERSPATFGALDCAPPRRRPVSKSPARRETPIHPPNPAHPSATAGRGRRDLPSGPAQTHDCASTGARPESGNVFLRPSQREPSTPRKRRRPPCHAIVTKRALEKHRRAVQATPDVLERN